MRINGCSHSAAKRSARAAIGANPQPFGCKGGVFTFEHLLGLSAQSALAILAAYGITDAEVVETAAPPSKYPQEGGNALVEARVVAVQDDGRRLIVSRFHVGDPRERDADDGRQSQ